MEMSIVRLICQIAGKVEKYISNKKFVVGRTVVTRAGTSSWVVQGNKA